MALTKCNHCGKPVSDRAVKCPHCGCNPKEEVKTEPMDRQPIEETETLVEQPTSTTTSSTTSTGKSSNKTLVIAVIIPVVALIICLIGYLTLNRGSGPTTNDTDTTAVDTVFVDPNMADSVVEGEELKYTTPTDLVRMNLKGKIKEITFTRYNPEEDPNDSGYGYQIWTSKFDKQGMLTSCSNTETPKDSNVGTVYFRNGKITHRTTAIGNYTYEYRQTDNYTVDVIQTDRDEQKELVMVLSFDDNGNLNKKDILNFNLDPYAYAAAYDNEGANFIVNYNTDGVEIDNKEFYWGNLTNEEKDSHGNWTERTYDNGLKLTRVIEYYE